MSEKSAKKKAAKAKKAAPKKVAKKKAAKVKPEKAEVKEETKVDLQRVELGPSPAPIVNSRHGFSMHERKARGYSMGELESAGVGIAEVKRLGIPMDIRRRTALDSNVQSLKGWYKAPEPKPAPPSTTEKPAPKAAAKRGKKAA